MLRRAERKVVRMGKGKMVNKENKRIEDRSGRDRGQWRGTMREEGSVGRREIRAKK